MPRDLAAYRYGDAYGETLELPSGSEIRLRLVRPSDKAAMQEGFRKMSPKSRYQRCMGQKSQLTDHELQYFTEVDGIDHFTICALRAGPGSVDEGIGTGSFVRLPNATETAEPAVTIIDSYQRKGLGTILLERLLGAAWERDIRWLHFELLADNLGMKRLLDAVSHHEVKFENDGAGCLIALFPVPEPEHPATEPVLVKHSPLFRVFAHIARTDVNVTVRHRATMPPPPPSPG